MFRMAASPARSHDTWSLAATTTERSEMVELISFSRLCRIHKMPGQRVRAPGCARILAGGRPRGWRPPTREIVTTGAANGNANHVPASPGYPWALFHAVRQVITAVGEKLRAAPRKCRKIFSSVFVWLAGFCTSRFPSDGSCAARRFVRGAARGGVRAGWRQRSGEIHAPKNSDHTPDSHTRARPGGRIRCCARARESPPADRLSHGRGRLLLRAAHRERKSGAVCRPQ